MAEQTPGKYNGRVSPEHADSYDWADGTRFGDRSEFAEPGTRVGPWQVGVILRDKNWKDLSKDRTADHRRPDPAAKETLQTD